MTGASEDPVAIRMTAGQTSCPAGHAQFPAHLFLLGVVLRATVFFPAVAFAIILAVPCSFLVNLVPGEDCIFQTASAVSRTRRCVHPERFGCIKLFRLGHHHERRRQSAQPIAPYESSEVFLTSLSLGEYYPRFYELVAPARAPSLVDDGRHSTPFHSQKFKSRINCSIHRHRCQVLLTTSLRWVGDTRYTRIHGTYKEGVVEHVS